MSKEPPSTIRQNSARRDASSGPDDDAERCGRRYQHCTPIAAQPQRGRGNEASERFALAWQRLEILPLQEAIIFSHTSQRSFQVVLPPELALIVGRTSMMGCLVSETCSASASSFQYCDFLQNPFGISRMKAVGAR